MKPEDDHGASGPYLWVALPSFPDRYLATIPVNVTSLLLEWEAMIDPIQALREEAAVVLEMDDFFITERFATPSFSMLNLLRLAAADEEIIESFRSAKARLRFPDAWKRPNVPLQSVAGEGKLTNTATPVLLGFATVTAVDARLGFKSDQVRRVMDEKAKTPISKNGSAV